MGYGFWNGGLPGGCVCLVGRGLGLCWYCLVTRMDGDLMLVCIRKCVFWDRLDICGEWGSWF